MRDVASAPKYCGDVRITDSETLRIVKEEAGFARCEIESILSRGFKGKKGSAHAAWVPQREHTHTHIHLPHIIISHQVAPERWASMW